MSSIALSAHHRLRRVMRLSGTSMGPTVVGSEPQEPLEKDNPESSRRLADWHWSGGSPLPSQGSPAHETQAAKRLATRCRRKCYCIAQW